ncbi:MAG TPA: GNAT family N-acetyltransferase [Prolixibacteraceae bacterium]|nr:GNAT family N-acetyltransferase [Prolixibacteraceae bacterium]
MIVPVTSSSELKLCAPVVQEAFQSVYNSAHPPFISERKLLEMYEQGMILFRFIQQNKTVGFVAMEQPDTEKPWWYIEKLSVLPAYRRKGIGTKLMQHVLREITRRGGTHISIALIDEEDDLQAWYQRFGFRHTNSLNYAHLPSIIHFMEYEILQFAIVPGQMPELSVLIGELDADLGERYGSNTIHGIDLSLADENGIHFVTGTYGKETICCGALRPIDPKRVELKRMFVRKAFRRRGFGEQLYRYLENRAREQSYSFLLLETGKNQVEAIQLYKKMGFTPIEKFGEYIQDPNSLCFSKQLS